MNKKRMLAVLLALTMAFCLTACGSGGGDNANAGGDASAVSSDSSEQKTLLTKMPPKWLQRET